MRPGFSFAEILFAIIILGIGFIMVAAIFPVAIQQAQSTSDEVSAATIARQATNAIAGLAAGSDVAPVQVPPITSTSPLFPGTDLYQVPTKGPATAGAQAAAIAVSPAPAPVPGQTLTSRGKVLCFFDPLRFDNTGTIKYATNLWSATSGNLISAINPTYAWIGLYKRDVTYTNSGGVITITNSPTMQLFIIPVQARAEATFTSTDVANTLTTPLLPLSVKVAIVPGSASTGGVSLLAFDMSAAGGNTSAFINAGAAAENAYVIISDDHISKPDGTAPVGSSDDRGYVNGRIFRLGARRTDLDNSSTGTALDAGLSTRAVFELQAGSDFTADNGPDGLAGLNTATTVDDDITAIGLTTANLTTNGTADAFLISKGFTPGTNNFDGAAMPVGAFTSFIAVN